MSEAKYRVGDTVLAKGAVVEGYDGASFLIAFGGNRTLWIKEADLIKIADAPLPEPEVNDEPGFNIVVEVRMEGGRRRYFRRTLKTNNFNWREMDFTGTGAPVVRMTWKGVKGLGEWSILNRKEGD